MFRIRIRNILGYLDPEPDPQLFLRTGSDPALDPDLSIYKQKFLEKFDFYNMVHLLSLLCLKADLTTSAGKWLFLLFFSDSAMGKGGGL